MSTASPLHDLVVHTLLPRWRYCALDERSGGFHERLDRELVPVDQGYQRLLVQCRQIFSFTEGFRLGCGDWSLDIATQGLDFVERHYWDEANGGWRFALGDRGPLPGNSRHLYAHAFVLLACASYFAATEDDRAQRIAAKTLDYLERFRCDNGGFYSLLDEGGAPVAGPREQNPHMHLFEAAMMAVESMSRTDCQVLAAELVDLFQHRFFDPPTGTLTEFFDDDWRPHADRGELLEPGHHFEWVWLLSRWQLLARPRSVDFGEITESLFDWSVSHGMDAVFGGIFNVVSRDGTVVESNKRIWPVAEAIKAFEFRRAVSGGEGRSSDPLVILLAETYCDTSRGTWFEVMDRELRPVVHEHPGTTLYHIVMAMRELEWLDQAGHAAFTLE